MCIQMAKDLVIHVRVSVEEKAALKKAAGAGGIGPYLRALGLAQANGIGPRTSVSDARVPDSPGVLDADSGSEGRDSAAKALPAKSWPARVRQLTASGVPRPAAERIADLEFRG